MCSIWHFVYSDSVDKFIKMLWETVSFKKKKVLTAQIYEMLNSWFIAQNIPPSEPRIPQKQLLIEMAAMIKQHVRDLMNTEVKSVIRPLRKYSPSYADDNGPHTEIILYEDDTFDVASHSAQERQ